MLKNVYKYIGMLVITLVLLGHHSFQAHAMTTSHHHHDVEHSCVGHDCHHSAEMEICEKIQSDEMQTSSDFFVLPEIGNFFAVEIQEKFVPFTLLKPIHERIPISHKQLARSHLVIA